MKITNAKGVRKGDEPIIYDVAVEELGFLVPFDTVEPNVDRSTGEHRSSDDGRRLWRVEAGVPGCKVSSMAGMAVVRLNIASADEPDVTPDQAIVPEGVVRLTGRVEGERDSRQGFLNVRCDGFRPFSGSTEVREPEIAGVPITIHADEPLVVLASSTPRSNWDGKPITNAGQELRRLQVQVRTKNTRRDTGEQFTSRETVFIDVPEVFAASNAVPFMGRVELIGLRCDARVTDRGQLVMDLRAAGYRIIEPAAQSAGRKGRRPSWEATETAETPAEPAA